MRKLSALLFSCLLVACGDDADRGEVITRFNHTVGGANLAHDEIIYTNAAGNEYGVTRLEYIVSDIALETAAGKHVALADFHYRNAFAGATRNVAAKVPGDRYAALHFTFGIDGAKNETGALPSIDHYNNMAWPTPMGGGYHYMRMEGLFRSGDGVEAFLTHTGPSGGGDYSFDVSLPIDLVVAGGEWEINVVMDINQWYDTPAIYDFGDRVGIMGNADAQSTLRDNGNSVFAVGSIRRHDRNAHDHGEEEVHQQAGSDHDHDQPAGG